MRTGKSGERERATSRGWKVEEQLPHEPELTSPVPEASASTEPDSVALDPADVLDETGQMSNLTVVMLGVTGGLFLLYGWVWMSWTQYYSAVNEATAAGSGSLGGVLQQIVYWVAPLAPVLWFISALALHLKEPKKLALAIFFGLVVTFPLPMVLTNGAAL